MAIAKPMDFLHQLAVQTLTDTTEKLGKVQQAYSHAAAQLGQLENYELEYQQQLHVTVSGKGIPVADLLNRQSFIDSLGGVVKQQASHVAKCLNMVDDTLLLWRKDQQRLNAFKTLKSRADSVQALKDNRQEQKLMDEFSQRAFHGRKVL